MKEEYALLRRDEDPLDEVGFADNRRHHNDIGISYHQSKMNTSSVLKVTLILSLCANLILMVVLFWMQFTPPSDAGQVAEVVSTPMSPLNQFMTSHNPKTSPVITTNTKYQETTTNKSTIPTTTEHIFLDPHQCSDDVSKSLPIPDYRNIFQDLNRQELLAVEKYLRRVHELKLKPPSHDIMSNFIFSIELHTPNKSAALQFLDNKGNVPTREAKAVLFLPSRNPPVVEEYVVGPIPNPSYHYRNPRRNKAINYRFRQFNNAEMSHAFNVVYGALTSKVEGFLKRHFGATVNQCKNKCFTFTSSAVSSTFSDNRKLWINLMYSVEFPTIHPTGIQFLLHMKGLKTSEWYIEKVWYANKLYDSFDQLIYHYEHGHTPRVSLHFPTAPEGEHRVHGSLHAQDEMFPPTPQAGPRQYEPQGHRYTVHNQHVEYLQQWSFNFRMSYAGAIQLYDINFRHQRIAYEVSLQEISVLYAGANPTTMHSQLTDSAFGLSRSAHGLMPSVDCPEYSTFLPVTLFGADHTSPADYPNSICIFEHNNAVPARRHMSRTGRGGRFYNGLPDNVLILRTVYVMYNYDYVMDFIFHQNGAFEAKVYSTGYILSGLYVPEENPYGFKVYDNIVGSIHHHMFNFKVDIDILGTANRYETLNFVVNNDTRSWLNDGYFPQLAFQRDLKETELKAAYKVNFDTPKYHVFYNNNKENKFSEKRGYRFHATGFAKQILPENAGALNSYSWSRYQMAVTKRKDEEEVSSSMHAIFDSADPVVSLQRFLDDDEDIVDQDLVAWVTLGMLHIPHTEDIPNTPTTGTEASITLLPYNYFEECPSMAARDSVRVDAHSAPATNYHGIQQDFNCIPRHIPEKQREKQRRMLFSSVG